VLLPERVLEAREAPAGALPVPVADVAQAVAWLRESGSLHRREHQR